MRTFATIAVVALLSSACYSQTIPSVDEALSKVNEVIDIPALKNLNISALNISALNISSLPINEAEDILRTKCEKNGGAGSYENAKKAGTKLFECVSGLVNFAVLKEEMDKARPTGDLDEVFKKYCNKKPTLDSCVRKFSGEIAPCLDPQERENRKIVMNITDKILNFVCFKEGDRIALFIAAKGPECFQQKAQVIGQCVNATLGNYNVSSLVNPETGLSGLTSEISKIKEIPPLVFDAKACRNMGNLQKCVVKELERCEDPTPANLLDSIFNYIRNVTPCDKLLKN